MKSKCPRCSANVSVPDNARYCSQCGYALFDPKVEIVETGGVRRGDFELLLGRLGTFIVVVETSHILVRDRYTTEDVFWVISAPVRKDELFEGGKWEDVRIVLKKRSLLDTTVKIAQEYMRISHKTATIHQLA